MRHHAKSCFFPSFKSLAKKTEQTTMLGNIVMKVKIIIQQPKCEREAT